MTKKIMSLIMVFACFFAVCGCNNQDRVFVPGTPENINWAAEIYEKVLETMPTKSYTATTNGSSVVGLGTGITLKIAGITMHTPSAVYFENISNGKEMLGNNTSFARRVYYHSPSPELSQYRFATTEKEKPVDSNGNIVINENEWQAVDISHGEFENKFGKSIHSPSNYNINKYTITASSSGVTSHDESKYVFQFVLDVSKGTSSPAVAGYVKQILTMSNQKCSSFDYVAVTFTVSSDYRILHCSVSESYNVSVGFIKPNTKNEISYTYEYDDTLTVKSF